MLLLPGDASAATTTVDATANAEMTAAESWAFAVFPPPREAHAPKPDPREVLHVTGSRVQYTRAQFDSIDDADWFPQDHATAPQIVRQGRKPARPCSECHMIGGAGVPATAALASLPKAYILEQIAAFRAGQRGMGGPATAHGMAEEARGLTPADLQQAVDYFSATKFVPHVRVVETARVPRTHWKFFVLVPDPGGASEPIGARIIETPVKFVDYSLSDGRGGYVAYVPPGSIARGASIAAKGTGAAPACESCHGARLQGVGMIPPLAGRSPTYIARELILFRTGRRNNPGAAPMVQEASQLTLDDMIAVAAYAGSRKP
ncbi:MAG TPA: c-type cytochrome [Rhodanobacter sp.]|nr:c-type cytochrome [Rhodanobacter sp.]